MYSTLLAYTPTVYMYIYMYVPKITSPSNTYTIRCICYPVLFKLYTDLDHFIIYI